MTSWPVMREEGRLKELLGSRREAQFWTTIFNKVYSGKIDTWDYQWAYANWVNNRVGILPTVNLISNIGFGLDATHTVRASDLANLPTKSLRFPLHHPSELIKNSKADEFTRNNWFTRPLWKKIWYRLYSFIK